MTVKKAVFVLSVCAVILAADDHPSSHTNNWAVLVRDENIIRMIVDKYLWYDPRPILCLNALGRIKTGVDFK